MLNSKYWYLTETTVRTQWWVKNCFSFEMKVLTHLLKQWTLLIRLALGSGDLSLICWIQEELSPILTNCHFPFTSMKKLRRNCRLCSLSTSPHEVIRAWVRKWPFCTVLYPLKVFPCTIYILFLPLSPLLPLPISFLPPCFFSEKGCH